MERQGLEELHEVNNHQEELGGSGYSSRETPNRQIQMNKKEHLQGVLHNRRFMPFIDYIKIVGV